MSVQAISTNFVQNTKGGRKCVNTFSRVLIFQSLELVDDAMCRLDDDRVRVTGVRAPEGVTERRLLMTTVLLH